MSVAEPPSITPLPLPEPPVGRPKVKKLRLLMLILGLGSLALVSTVFGMMMAVASDLGDLASDKRFRDAPNSILEDDQGRQIGVLVNNQNLVFVPYEEIAPVMRYAIIAIEDKRFYTNSGIDLRGIGRAFFNDVFGGGGTQGGSTITQQFVKNAENQQSNRTVFEKLREAAMAYHLTRKWTKNKILTQYLNTIYFGNGAYGVESAARIYFGNDHPGCGTRGQPACASLLRPDEAALLAGMVANPTGYDPQNRWRAAMGRRNVVLAKMLEQSYITRENYDAALAETAPPVILPPQEQVKVADPTNPGRDLNVGYFNNWVRQQLVDRYGAQQAFRGGWRVRTTLDIDMQAAAENAVRSYLPYDANNPERPTASMVVIDNASGAVRAMVGGPDYGTRPFNLATQGQRQPGSAFKPFVLAAAIRAGISPSQTFESRKKIFTVPGSGGKEKFVVNNYEGNYSGITTLANATTYSDNSVYAEVGFKTGFANISKMARAMGIRTPVSTNPAITLGGLKRGVTVLDMAHAYETFADAVTPILQSVVSHGTGVKAQYGGFAAGKTGTTENYGDAWFVGYTEKYTIAVWVGYPDSVRSMKTDYGGSPVAGGTFPAQIWRAFVVQAAQIDAQRAADLAAKRGEAAPAVTTGVGTTPAPVATDTTGTTPSATSTTTTPATTTPAASGNSPTAPASPQTPVPKQPSQPAKPPPAGGGADPGSTGGASPGTGGAAPPP